MLCCGCCEVSGGCWAVDGLLCCALNWAATSSVLRMLMIRCCTVIKPLGNFLVFAISDLGNKALRSLFGLHIFGLNWTGAAGIAFKTIAVGPGGKQAGQISVSVPIMLDAVFEAAG